MTLVRSFRVKPKPGGSFTIETPGAALIVRSGGWPGMRMFFDEQSEQYVGERSVPVEDCATHVRAFNRVTIKFPAVVGPLDLVLETADCGVLALAPTDGCAPRSRTRYVARSVDASIGEAATVTLASFLPSPAEYGNDDADEFYTGDAYLGGFWRATRASGGNGLTLVLYAVHRKLDGTAVDVPIMQFPALANATYAGGDFVGSVEFGGTRTFASGISSGLAPLPRPGWRLDAVAGAATAFSNFNATIYTRSLL